MTEEQAEQAQAQSREFPETLKIMGRLRTALADRLFQTAVSAKDEREAIFLRVQTLDAMTGEVKMLLANQAGEKAIEEYIQSLATTTPDSQA